MPENPTTTDKYFSFDIFSSFKISLTHIAVKIGAELINKVTRPDEIYCSANINAQLTKNIEASPVNEASLRSCLSNLSVLKII